MARSLRLSRARDRDVIFNWVREGLFEVVNAVFIWDDDYQR